MTKTEHPRDKYKHVLEKGRDMKMSELKMLFDRGVPFDTIKKALKMGHFTLVDLIEYYGIDYGSDRG